MRRTIPRAARLLKAARHSAAPRQFSLQTQTRDPTAAGTLAAGAPPSERQTAERKDKTQLHLYGLPSSFSMNKCAPAPPASRNFRLRARPRLGLVRRQPAD